MLIHDHLEKVDLISLKLDVDKLDIADLQTVSHDIIKTRIYESLAGCRTMVIFAVCCKIGALERNAY